MLSILFALSLVANIIVGLIRYILWPLTLLALLGPFGLVVWMFIH